MVYGQTNAAVTSQTIAQLWFGAYNATSITSGIRIKGAALFDKVLTDEEIRTAVDALQANAEQTVAARPWYHIHEGDSLSAVTFFPAVAARDMTPPTVFANYAVGGSSFTDHNVRRPSILAVPAGVGSGEQSLFTIYAASNELSKVGVSVSDFLNTYVEYITAIRNAGYDLIGVGTLLPTTIAGYNTKRNEANTTIYTWPGTGFVDFLFDFAADSTLGPDAAASDTMWYIDGIHPTTAGQAILKTIYQTAVETALAA